MEMRRRTKWLLIGAAMLGAAVGAAGIAGAATGTSSSSSSTTVPAAQSQDPATAPNGYGQAPPDRNADHPCPRDGQNGGAPAAPGANAPANNGGTETNI